MIDPEQLSMLIYQHAVQLSLIDYEAGEAFKIAHEIAVLAFDATFTDKGLAEARKRLGWANEAVAVTDAETAKESSI